MSGVGADECSIYFPWVNFIIAGLLFGIFDELRQIVPVCDNCGF